MSLGGSKCWNIAQQILAPTVSAPRCMSTSPPKGGADTAVVSAKTGSLRGCLGLGAAMAREIPKKELAGTDTGVKRRGLLRFGTLVTAFTGASAISAFSANSAQAGPGDKNPPGAYVPIAEKGVASGVATLDVGSK